ncbi:MAG: DUF4838 domain-containing protein [Bacteroidales bacterium]|nr:DUF4838 domain-containing protein [Bacteroidales bacterium]
MKPCPISSNLPAVAAVALLVLTAPSCRHESFVISPEYSYSVVTGTGADPLTLKAASELENYFLRVTGKSLPVSDVTEPGTKIIFIGKGGLQEENLAGEMAIVSSDGFIISSEPDKLVLAGNNGNADLSAVYTLFEEHAGCMRFTEKEDYVPPASKIRVPVKHKVYEPAFSFRVAHFPDREKPGFTAWNKLSTFSEWGMFVHTFPQLMPPSKYFSKHPEYFSLVNGRRIRDGQLCLSNPDVIRILSENLALRMSQAPEKVYWSVSQNDCINYCECPECKKLYEKYGAVSGAYIEMANSIAAKFPEKQISTLAYQFTRQAPVNIKPAENVNVMFCSIECNRSLPLAEDPRSAGFVRDLMEWSSLTDNIFMWDYVVQFRTYLCPFPNFHVLQPNIQLFHSQNIPMMFQQGSGSSWSDLAELKQYYIAKMLWDPYLNGDSLINRFLDKYYGKAAPFIREYFDLSHSSLMSVADSQNLDIYGLPSFYFKSFLTRDLVTKYHGLMNRAEAATGNDSARLERVMRARMSVDFAWLDYALNAGDTALSFVKTTPAGKVINEDMMTELDRVTRNSEMSGVATVSEHNYSMTDYSEHIHRIISMGVKENRAGPDDFRSLTPVHPSYESLGAASMADGIFGGRTFTSGWLGYEGEDMIMEINPGSPDEVSRISMNFLCDHVSWIFLPSEVIIEASENGTDFVIVASRKFATTTFDQDIIPVHMDYEFPPVKISKLRITARSLKKCPEWHRGAGQPSWIFIDEIVVE